jgi:hypothetical protein
MAVDKALYGAPKGMKDRAAAEEPLEIEIEDPERVEMSIGGEEILEIEPGDEGDMIPHSANLAEYIDDQQCAQIADELLEAYATDVQSRAEWEETYHDGLELLGLKIEDRSEPWEGAFGVYHPLLAEAVVKFQSESIVETFPAQGPVRTKVLGKGNREKEEAATRVREDMNYLLTEKMADYRSEHERLLWNLPIAGSAFKKVFYDPSLERPVAQFIPAEDFVVSYGASSLESAQRYTHRMKRTKNEIRKMQVSGFYKECEIGDPTADEDDISKRKDEIGGFDAAQDDRYTLLEVHCELDIDGFEDLDKFGEPTGIELPYVVTILKDSGKVLSIYRNWAEDDEKKRKQIHFSHYNYIPGFGFYGFGLIHLIGGFAKGATSIMRQLVDAGTLSNLPGGFRTRGLRIRGGDTPIAPGEFRDVDVPTGTIKDNIMPLPYKEPSTVLAGLLDKIVEEARRFASMSDISVGDMQPNAPVGSTLAILERQLKTLTAVQARMHAAMKSEFKILKSIVADMSPDDEYSYEPIGDEGFMARRRDYMMTNIIPVSDPNASTMSQRIVQYQAAMQLAQQAPQLYDLPLLHRQMIQTLGIKNAEELIPDEDDIKAADPMTENMALLNGKPVKAFPYQDHEAHIQAHMAFAQDPEIAKMIEMEGEAGKMKLAAGMAHINEHIAQQYRQRVEKELGVPLPAYDPEEDGETLSQEQELAISRLVAEAAPRVTGKAQQMAQAEEAAKKAQDPVVQMQERELELERGELERKIQKDKMDYELKLRDMEIEAARISSQEKQAGAAIGSKLRQQVAEAEADLEETGVKIGADLAEKRIEAQQNLLSQMMQQQQRSQSENDGNEQE